MRRFVFALALLLAASPALARCPSWHPDEGVFEAQKREWCEEDDRRPRLQRDFEAEDAARQRQESLDLQREQLQLERERLRREKEREERAAQERIFRMPVTCTRVDARTVICQ
jgi:hypothetical protein